MISSPETFDNNNNNFLWSKTLKLQSYIPSEGKLTTSNLIGAITAVKVFVTLVSFRDALRSHCVQALKLSRGTRGTRQGDRC